MRLFINNGLIVNPENSLETMGDLVIEDGVIKEISLHRNQKPGQDELKDKTEKIDTEEEIHLDVQGRWIVPGLIDLHVHLREPGFEYKEDIESGCRSAAKGGFTTICCMPNTSPVIDSSYVVLMIDSRAEESNGVQVLCIGASTKGQEGKELADYEGMLRTGSHSAQLTGSGICGISDDGKTVQDDNLMLASMIKAKELGLTVFSHAEPEAEIVKRDLTLAEATGCKLHFCHISEKRSIDLIREAKKRGINVTAETAPHYFSLSCSDVDGDTNKKMNPPLRQKADVEAVRQALKDGTIDAIATDHAPHHEREKDLPFEEAPNGVIGLETSFPVSYTELVKTGILTPLELISKMSTKPAEILGINRGSLWIGEPADLTIIDVEKEYEIQSEAFESKGKNSPFLGKKVSGQTVCTVVDGQIVWKNETGNMEV
ncbi:MAG TPA: dihydroorotase [Anaerovoracaceae bacterium]|nr:dihydroorotase [Anaerovoracaceae bacterium]